MDWGSAGHGVVLRALQRRGGEFARVGVDQRKLQESSVADAPQSTSAKPEGGTK